MEAPPLQYQEPHALAAPAPRSTPREFVPLDREARTHVDTATMCWHIGITPQTARLWACKQTFPKDLTPVRVKGRLRWPVAGIRKLLGVW